MDLSIRRSSLDAAVMAALVLLALFLRVWVFQIHAVGWDPNEYCWTARRGWLPHGPYLLHAVAGWLIAALVDAEWGLSLLSLASNLLAAWLFHRLLIRQNMDTPTRRVALGTYLLLPVSTYQAGMQEVYAFQGAWTLAALWALSCDKRWSPWVSGATFGLACLAHDGSFFLVPGFLAMVWLQASAQPFRRLVRRWATWAFAATLFPVIGVCALLLRYRTLFAGRAWALTLTQLRGVSPIPGHARPDTAVLTALHRLGENLSSPVALGWSPWLLMVIPVLALVWTSRRRYVLAWIIWALPYLLYEVAVGGSPDAGAYLVYVVPSAAVLTGEAFSGAWWAISSRARRLSRGTASERLARLVLVPATLLLLLVPGLHPLLTVDPWWQLPPANVGNRSLMQWLARMTPDDTLLVGVGTGAQALAIGCRAGREVVQTDPLFPGSRPEDRSQGYWILTRPAIGSGITRPFLQRLTPARLETLIDAGRLVLSLQEEPFELERDHALHDAVGSTFLLRPYEPRRAGTVPPGMVYRVMAAPSPTIDDHDPAAPPDRPPP